MFNSSKYFDLIDESYFIMKGGKAKREVLKGKRERGRERAKHIVTKRGAHASVLTFEPQSFHQFLAQTTGGGTAEAVAAVAGRYHQHDSRLYWLTDDERKFFKQERNSVAH